MEEGRFPSHSALNSRQRFLQKVGQIGRQGVDSHQFKWNALPQLATKRQKP
jgi:hypothetical protein